MGRSRTLLRRRRRIDEDSAAVRHENVVQIYDVEETPIPYLVMEFIPGETLQQRLDRTGPLDVSEILRIGREIAEGLAAAHAKDLIHRDIKPANVLIEGGQLRAKLTDFGLARAADDASISESGLIAGTPMYMAPEQALGLELDQRVDLFSLGSVMYQMTSGRPPFRANSTVAVLRRVADDTPRPIREIIPETPQWLCDIISRLHAKNPDDRYQSAREVADLLARCESQLKSNVKVRDAAIIPMMRPTRKSSKWIWRFAGAVVLSLLVLGVYALTRPDSLPEKQEIASTPELPEVIPSKLEPVVKVPSGDLEIERIAALPADEQGEAIRKELKKRNPEFDGQINLQLADGKADRLVLEGPRMRDISPVRALTTLRDFAIHSPEFSDVSPLRGMELTSMAIYNSEIADLSPLKGMKLTHLDLAGSRKLSDLSPLKGMPLSELTLYLSTVHDLTPLIGMKLTLLNADSSAVTDLTPLRGMPLGYLNLTNTKVSDLSPLQGMPLKHMDIRKCQIQPKRDGDILRSMTQLEKLNDGPPADYLKKLEAGTNNDD